MDNEDAFINFIKEVKKRLPNLRLIDFSNMKRGLDWGRVDIEIKYLTGPYVPCSSKEGCIHY